MVVAPQVVRYLQVLIQRLRGRFAAEHEFTVAIFDDWAGFTPAAHAFPAPHVQKKSSEVIATCDGTMFVPASLLERLESGERITHILAHAMAHVADRHVTRLITRESLVAQTIAGMPPEMRRQHLSVSPALDAQQRQVFEQRAEELAKGWAGH